MRLGRSLSFRVLTSPSLCRLQDVSAPQPVAFFPYPNKSLPLPSPESKRPSLVAFFSCPDKSSRFPSPERECPSLGRFFSMS